jgi:large subunit ribosomal protein L29
MKASEIREMGLDETRRKLTDLKQEYFNLRFQHGAGQLENTSKLVIARRDIARVETVLRELSLNNNPNNDTSKE